MKPFLSLLLAGLCLMAIASTSAVARTAPDVDMRDLMTAHDFQRAGLDKLTPQQLAALNAWLAHYLETRNGAAPAAAAAPAPKARPAAPAPVAAVPAPASPGGVAAFGAPPAPQPVDTPDHIESRIAGTFNGFHSGAIFKLENGQVWKETDSVDFDTRRDQPKVYIKKSWSGYLMRVEGYGKQAFVQRIK